MTAAGAERSATILTPCVEGLSDRQTALPTTAVMGVEMVAATLDAAAEATMALATAGAGGYIVHCNVHVLTTSFDDAELAEALRSAALVMPDGAPLAWLQRRLGLRQAERLGGPDLMPLVLDRGRKIGLRHAFVGSTSEVLGALAENVMKSFPGVDIVATHSPATAAVDDLAQIVEELEGVEADVVWLALGAPKQELWMYRYAAKLSPTLVVGVGAAFDFHAQTKARAPRVIRRLGLEWAHRLAHEPRRLFGRYARSGVVFAARVPGCLLRRGAG